MKPLADLLFQQGEQAHDFLEMMAGIGILFELDLQRGELIVDRGAFDVAGCFLKQVECRFARGFRSFD